MKDIRIKRLGAVDDVTTTIQTHPVRGGGVELCIEQYAYKHLDKKFTPRRLVMVTVPQEHLQTLIDALKESVT